MTGRRLIVIIFIFACTSIAWAILGGSISARTYLGYDTLSREVAELWGAPHIQMVPTVSLAVPERSPMTGELESSHIRVDFHLQHRRKGLLWYATYAVAFDGTYTLRWRC